MKIYSAYLFLVLCGHKGGAQAVCGVGVPVSDHECAQASIR